MWFTPTAEPESPLARYRLLSPTASVRVSPLCLGTMGFGDAWKDSMGTCDKTQTFEILDFFYKNGGNFIDTANNYQDEESEKWIGEWMAERGIRDEMVIATKFTTCYVKYEGSNKTLKVNYGGNSIKSLKVSVDESLKKLKTTYIDLLYVHWWDYTTSIPELMQGLNRLVLEGKVLYLGISDTPAWVVSKANEYARNHGLRQFSVYQGQWSAGYRSFERDIIPMARDEGMALAPFGALGGGKFKSEEQRAKAEEGRTGAYAIVNESDKAISLALEKVAKQLGTQITSVALAYVMHKTTHVFPIVGGRTVEHLKGNIAALKLRLDESQIKEIESAVEFDPGFPHSMLGSSAKTNPFIGGAGWLDHVDNLQPIRPTGQ